MSHRYSVPAVVVGLTPTGLSLVRALAPRCSRVIALESNPAEPGTRTRLAEVKMVHSLSDHDALLEELVALARTLPEKPVLFLSSDEHVTWAGKVRAELERHYRFALPPAEVIDTLMFKDQFLAFADVHRLPVPRSAFLPLATLAEEVERAMLEFPVIIKPTNKAGEWERRGLSKAYIARTLDDVRGVAELAAGVVDGVLVQEYLEGGDDHVYFCLYFSAPNLPEPVLFTGRKLLQWPPLRGSTAVCEPADAPELAAFTKSLFGRLGVEGFCSLEVKMLDDGAFKIIEPTVGRVDLQSHVATLNGLNIPLVAYLCAIGRPAEAEAYAHPTRSDVVWVYEDSLYSLMRIGAVAPSFLYDLARRSKGFALADWSDPRVIGAFAEEKLERLARRAWARLKPPEKKQSPLPEIPGEG